MTEPTLAQLSLVIGSVVIAMLAGALALVKGWDSLLAKFKTITEEHEVRENKQSAEEEVRAAEFRKEVLDRLERVEGEVQGIREHLIARGEIPASTGPGWPLKR